MNRKFWVMGMITAILALVVALPSVAGAQTAPVAFGGSLTGLTAGAGDVVVTLEAGWIEIYTTGEISSSMMDCGGDAVCMGLGLNGASMTTLHNSEVKLFHTLVPGTFDVAGKLEGTFTLGGIPGVFQATIAGTASCFAVPGDPCATFSTSITDTGKWEAPAIGGEGDLSLTIAGVIGVGLVGGGSMGGTLELPEPDAD